MTHRHVLCSLGLAVGLLVAASSASAETPEIFDWSHEKAPVLVHTEGGLVFLGKDRAPRRAYDWDRAEGDKSQSLFLPDLDGDGNYEIVGAGDPTFALHESSNPAWSIEDGCDQAIVADFAANDKMDVMCQDGDAIDIYTHDDQKIWSAELGVGLEWCRAGDINGDLKADIECKLDGRDKYTRIDVNGGKLMTQSSEEVELDKGTVELEEASPVDSKVWTGTKEFDLNGDGTAEESLKADGSAIVIQSRSKDKAVARIELDGEVQAALVKNIDGKKTPEIVALTNDEIVVTDAEGETLGTYPVDADDYERRPVAAIDSIYARGFKSSKKAQKVVREARDQLAACYSDRIEGGLFVGIGQVIYKTHIDDEGGVERIEKMHSAIRDREVEGCAEDVLEDLEFPSPAKKEEGEGRKKATVNITLKFTFADEPE
jgi:hypothetical protein